MNAAVNQVLSVTKVELIHIKIGETCAINGSDFFRLPKFITSPGVAMSDYSASGGTTTTATLSPWYVDIHSLSPTCAAPVTP